MIAANSWGSGPNGSWVSGDCAAVGISLPLHYGARWGEPMEKALPPADRCVPFADC
ncbi:hypothetical protein GCM10010331_36000 [Streptomyces xanthochromogenes]|nr:hypothetical protein GCM10010331_36000 [Streptomyces xanthochromogenes]